MSTFHRHMAKESRLTLLDENIPDDQRQRMNKLGLRVQYLWITKFEVYKDIFGKTSGLRSLIAWTSVHRL
jgi:hypothetical protein